MKNWNKIGSNKRRKEVALWLPPIRVTGLGELEPSVPPSIRVASEENGSSGAKAR
jgi:hypothetical protein